jgi:hypothetical protein
MKKNSALEPIDDQLRQTSMWEFMDGEGASNESNHEVVGKGIKPTTQTKPKEDGAIS